MVWYTCTWCGTLRVKMSSESIRTSSDGFCARSPMTVAVTDTFSYDALLLELAIKMSKQGFEQRRKDDRLVAYANSVNERLGIIDPIKRISPFTLEQRIAYRCSYSSICPKEIQLLVTQFKSSRPSRNASNKSEKIKYRLEVGEVNVTYDHLTIMRSLQRGGFPKRGTAEWTERCSYIAGELDWAPLDVEFELDFLVDYYRFTGLVAAAPDYANDIAELCRLLEQYENALSSFGDTPADSAVFVVNPRKASEKNRNSKSVRGKRVRDAVNEVEMTGEEVERRLLPHKKSTAAAGTTLNCDKSSPLSLSTEAAAASTTRPLQLNRSAEERRNFSRVADATSIRTPGAHGGRGFGHGRGRGCGPHVPPVRDANVETATSTIDSTAILDSRVKKCIEEMLHPIATEMAELKGMLQKVTAQMMESQAASQKQANDLAIENARLRERVLVLTEDKERAKKSAKKVAYAVINS